MPRLNRKLFHKLLPFEKAIEIIEQTIKLKPRGTETLNLLDAVYRVLAVDIYAKIDYPPFDRSEVDGYAVRAEDTYGASDIRHIKLRVIGSIDIGEEPVYEVTPGIAIEIATGAPIPRGSDAIVMEEYVHRENSLISVYKAVTPLENIATAGSDIPLNDLVIPKGMRLGPFELGILAALGYDSVEVYLKPRIAVVSIGKELVQPGNRLRYGQLYDYNGYAISAYIKSLGAEAHYLGIIPDNENMLSRILSECINKYDIIVTSGGTSAGIGDIVYTVVESLGEVLVHGLEVKPGKPTLIGLVQNKLIIGLPGFPFSAISRTLTLVKYVVEKISGIENPVIWSNIRAKIAQKIRKEVGKDLYIPIVFVNHGTEFLAIPVPYRSGSISPMLKANAIAVIHRDIETINEGDEVEIIPLSLDIPETIFIGSHDTLLPILIRHLGLTSKCRLIFVGSLAGLVNIAKGYGDIAPIHLLDIETNTYNINYAKQYKNIVLISGYRRKLVLAFKHGNPKNIKSFEDFLRSDVRIVNRNRGSGTRTYMDMMLYRLANKINIKFEELIQKINGYTYEVSSHTGVASAIAQGRADTGICVEYVAKLYNLDYISLTWEEYDFVINKHSILSKQTIKIFIDFLRSDSFRKTIEMFQGYEAKRDTGEIIYS